MTDSGDRTHITRRRFLASALAAGLAPAALGAASVPRRPRILLRSSWQVVNIGDIAHTPGVLALIKQHVPQAETRLWASASLTPEVAAMLRRRFPGLVIVKGHFNEKGQASTADLGEAVEWCDFLLHGSGPSLVARKDVEAFVTHVKQPYGVFGITLEQKFLNPEMVELLSAARFLFFRDSVSLAEVKKAGVRSPVLEFGPDGAFACDLRNDSEAEDFLKANGLAEGRFLCCLTRHRRPPYWDIPNMHFRFDPKGAARNEVMTDHDHKALRETIVAVTRETPLKVLLCPEDMTQMALGKAMFWDKLPSDVRKRVVWREDFWLTDLALSVYVRSAGLFGSEMHSPIMAVGNGIPAIVCRFAEQTSKCEMWRDIGLGDWLFDLDDEADHARIQPAVLEMAQNPEAAREKTLRARAFVRQQQRAMCDSLARQFP